MIRRYHLVFLLLAGMGICSTLLTRNAYSTPVDRAAICGEQLSARDVLVLDVRHLSNQPEQAQQYLLEQAGEYRLAKPIIQEIYLKSRPSKDPDAVTQRARKLGMERGCDLAVILKTGPYMGKQRGRKAIVKDKGYAMVSIGQRTFDGR